MSESSNSYFSYPEMGDSDKPQFYKFDKLVAYIEFLRAYYNQRLGYEIPCFRDFSNLFKLLNLMQVTTAKTDAEKILAKKNQIVQFYKWISEKVNHVQDEMQATTFMLQFIEHKAKEEKIDLKVVDSEHVMELGHLLWLNIESERELRKKK